MNIRQEKKVKEGRELANRILNNSYWCQKNLEEFKIIKCYSQLKELEQYATKLCDLLASLNENSD